MTNETRPKWEDSRIAPAIRKRMENRNAEAASLLASRGYTVVSPDQREEALRTIANAVKKIRKIQHAQADWIDLLPEIEVAVTDAFGIERGTLRDYADLDHDEY